MGLPPPAPRRGGAPAGRRHPRRPGRGRLRRPGARPRHSHPPTYYLPRTAFTDGVLHPASAGPSASGRARPATSTSSSTAASSTTSAGGTRPRATTASPSSPTASRSTRSRSTRSPSTASGSSPSPAGSTAAGSPPTSSARSRAARAPGAGETAGDALSACSPDSLTSGDRFAASSPLAVRRCRPTPTLDAARAQRARSPAGAARGHGLAGAVGLLGLRLPRRARRRRTRERPADLGLVGDREATCPPPPATPTSATRPRAPITSTVTAPSRSTGR